MAMHRGREVDGLLLRPLCRRNEAEIARLLFSNPMGTTADLNLAREDLRCGRAISRLLSAPSSVHIASEPGLSITLCKSAQSAHLPIHV